MRTTTDTLTGKPFRWNCTVRLIEGVVVPARETRNDLRYLHFERVPAKLLAELNPR